MRRLIFLFAVLLSGCLGIEEPDRRIYIFATPHHDFSVIKTGTGGSERILFDGDITEDSAAALRNTIENTQTIDRIQLASPGGLLHEAYDLRERIANRGAVTISRGECYSACTHLFRAGSKRIVTPDARLGFHMIGVLADPEKEFDRERALDLIWGVERGYWKSQGVDDEFLEQVRATPHSEIWHPNLETLIAQDIVTHVLDGDELVDAIDYCQRQDCDG